MDLGNAITYANKLFGGIKPAAATVKRYEDYPQSGYNKDDIGAGAEATLINVEAKANTTILFMGLSAAGLEKLLLTIYGPESRPIISNLAGATIGQGEKGHQFMVPHIVKPGETYEVVAKNISAAAVTKLTAFLTVYGAKVFWS